MDINRISELNEHFANLSASDIIKEVDSMFNNKVVFASSLGVEDQLITYFISTINKKFRVITLDTGRVFPETYNLLHRTVNRFGVNIEVLFPDAKDVEQMVNEKGINLFYESVENRKLCCEIRKIKPLKRALVGVEAWVTGLRREQSVTRLNMNIVEWDNANNVIKINPLWNWSEQEVWQFVREHNIPYNELHDKGFPSIGCQPCTRAIQNNENVRAGRWWWELPENKECGLHKH